MSTAYGSNEYGGRETESLLDVPVPTPGPSEMRVAVRAAGVNPVDWKIRAGYLAEMMPLDLASEALRGVEAGHSRGNAVLLVG